MRARATLERAAVQAAGANFSRNIELGKDATVLGDEHQTSLDDRVRWQPRELRRHRADACAGDRS